MKVLIAAAQVVIIKSSITPQDITTLKSYKPSALVLTDPTDKSVLFTVGNAVEDPSISNNGILVHKDRDVTIKFNKPITEAKVRELYGVALARLAALEAQVQAALDEVNALGAQVAIEAVNFAGEE